MKLIQFSLAALLVCIGVAQGQAAIYSNGFEVNTFDWSGVTQVSSGTGGITSAAGAFHGVASIPSISGALTQWGGYNFGAGNAVPTAFQEYTTSVDIYLNVGGSLPNDSRFDYTSAINNAAGTHLRDFAFNVGFYNDAIGPGANTSRFVVSASNNVFSANSFPKNPARDPVAISTTGWYTFEHHFYDDGGTLAADLSIYDASDNLINSWTLSNAADLIAGVGGNRYGWFPYDTSPGTGVTPIRELAIDNAQMGFADNGVVPEPMTLAVWSLLGVCGTAFAWRTRCRAEG